MAERLLRKAQGLIDHTFLVGTTPTDPDGNVATVDITRGNGTVFATGAATVRQSAGVYRYTLAPQTNLERFTFVFKGTFSGVAQESSPMVVEIVGGFIVSIVDIRALEGLSSAAGITAYPNARLAEARTWFEDVVERFCGTAFVPRYGIETLDGNGTDTVLLGTRPIRSVLSGTLDGVSVTVGDMSFWPYGKLRYSEGVFTNDYRNLVVTYEHGMTAPPADVREAALVAIRDRVLGFATGVPPQATGLNAEFATMQLSVPGVDTPTGIPFVDEVLRGYRSKVPAIA